MITRRIEAVRPTQRSRRRQNTSIRRSARPAGGRGRPLARHDRPVSVLRPNDDDRVGRRQVARSRRVALTTSMAWLDQRARRQWPHGHPGREVTAAIRPPPPTCPRMCGQARPCRSSIEERSHPVGDASDRRPAAAIALRNRTTSPGSPVRRCRSSRRTVREQPSGHTGRRDHSDPWGQTPCQRICR